MIQIGTIHNTLSYLHHPYYLPVTVSQQDTLWKIFWRHIISDESPMFSHLQEACSESLDQNTTSLQDHRAACYTAMIFFSKLFDPRSQSSYKALNLRYTAFEDYCIESQPGQRIHIGRVFTEDQVASVILGWKNIIEVRYSLTSKISTNVISLRFGHGANNSIWRRVISMAKQIKGIAGDLVQENK